MSKIGSLVGIEIAKFTDNEKKYMLEFAERMFKIAFPDKEYKLKFETLHNEAFNVVIEKPFKNSATYRFNDSGDVAKPAAFFFSFNKSLAYDEEEEGVSYEWKKMGKGDNYKPECKYTNYSLMFSFLGTCRKYRGRLKVFSSIFSGDKSFHTYSYGTEITDLEDVYSLMKEIKESFSNSSIEKHKPIN